MGTVTAGRLADKVIVIMGGSSGLGLAGAQVCQREGARLVLVGRTPDTLDAALATLDGDRAVPICGDACYATTSEFAIGLAVEKWGRLDGLYHVAGGSGRALGDGPLHEMTEEGLEATLALNLTSVIYSNRAAVRQFLAQRTGGAILNMGSVLGSSPSPGFFASHAYAAAKSGIVGFSTSIASYYAPHQIRVNVITPALVATPMSERAQANEAIQNFITTKQPLDGGRMGRPEDADEAVVLLLSDAARFITGQVLAVDGGWTVTEGQMPPAS
jgi:NAD(P)-dependent dehydrogenase (short-subunit alcohol dehydrogenase family)